jgi:DNA polymerase III delta prime subunit
MKIYKITEASDCLGVSINTLKTLANNGKVKSFKTTGEPKVCNEDGTCPLCKPRPDLAEAPPAPSGRMSDTAFQSALDNDDEYAIAMEASRAREGEEIEARRANGAELLVDAREAEIAALKALLREFLSLHKVNRERMKNFGANEFLSNPTVEKEAEEALRG